MFGTAIHLGVPDNPIEVRLADINGDGILDVAGLNYEGFASGDLYAVRWWTADGLGGFTPSAPLQIVENVLSLAPIDLVGGGWFDPNLYFHPTVAGDPTAGIVMPLSIPVGSGFNVRAADVDGDGDEDLVVISGDVDRTRIVVVENRGGGVFVPEATQVFAGGSVFWWDVFRSDWDGDLDVDLMANVQLGFAGPMHCWVLENDGSDRFRYRNDIELRGEGMGGGVADLDPDGFEDFVGPRAIAFGRGTFHSAPEPFELSGFLPRDFEDDGDVDFYDYFGEIGINDGQGEIDFTASLWPDPPDDHAYDLAVVAIDDLDGDGRADYLVSYYELVQLGGGIVLKEFREMRCLLADRLGGFADHGPALPPGTQLFNDVDGHIRNPVADLDGDGDVDLVRAGGYWPNDGSTFFPGFVTLFAGWTPVAIADADGDGDLDVLAYQQSGGMTTIALLRHGTGMSFPPWR